MSSHSSAQPHLSIILALHQQATNQLGDDKLLRDGQIRSGGGVGGRGGYGSGLTIGENKRWANKRIKMLKINNSRWNFYWH